MEYVHYGYQIKKRYAKLTWISKPESIITQIWSLVIKDNKDYPIPLVSVVLIVQIKSV
jgi:hypothetical protein